MNTAALIVCYLIIGAVALSVIAVAVWYIVAALLDARDRLVASRREDIAREIGGRMREDGWWFSEDHSTMRAVQLIGEKLSTKAYYDVSTVRELWRKERSDRIHEQGVQFKMREAAEAKLAKAKCFCEPGEKVAQWGHTQRCMQQLNDIAKDALSSRTPDGKDKPR